MNKQKWYPHAKNAQQQIYRTPPHGRPREDLSFGNS